MTNCPVISMALSPMEPSTAEFPPSPGTEIKPCSGNSIQAVELVLFWLVFFFSQDLEFWFCTEYIQRKYYFFPLGITIRIRLKHPEIQSGCSLTTDTSNASFLAICSCNFFLQGFHCFFNYIIMVFSMSCLENYEYSPAL